MSLAPIIAFLMSPAGLSILSAIFGYILRHFGVGMSVFGKFLPEVETVASKIVADEPAVKSELSILLPGMSDKVGKSLDELAAIAKVVNDLSIKLQPFATPASAPAAPVAK